MTILHKSNKKKQTLQNIIRKPIFSEQKIPYLKKTRVLSY